MAIWIEFRCEGRGGDNEDCESDHNNDPGLLSDEDAASVAKSFSDLKKQAKDSGWAKTKHGWLCERCLARIKDKSFLPQ